MLAFPRRMSFEIIQMENNHLKNEYTPTEEKENVTVK